MAHPVMVAWIIANDNIDKCSHKLFSGTMTSAKKIVVEFILPNVETSVVSGSTSTTNESFQLSAQLRLRSNLLPIDSAAQMLKLLS